MSESTGEKLVFKLNQIARNLEYDADPVGTIAKHVTTFWSPRTKAILFAWIAGEGAGTLDLKAQEALMRLTSAGADAA